MPRNGGLARIIRQEDGTSKAVWSIFELQTAFQPIFAFEEGKLNMVAFEGLIRPFRDGESLSPPAFFGLIPAGERFQLETLMRSLHLLNAGACLDRTTSIFINFDPSLCSDRALADVALRDMRLVLDEAGIQPDRVVCEVTEQKTHPGRTLFDFVEALRAHGFRIAVDDYGAEDSDMRRIEDLRPDIVKFDARWITQLMESGPGFALLSAMVQQFETHGIRTVFEGIEEGWQLELAEKAGASMVQGYALARPELVPTSFSSFVPAVRRNAVPDLSAGAGEPAERSVQPSAQPVFGRRSRP